MKTPEISDEMIAQLAAIINEINATSPAVEPPKLEYRVYYNSEGGVVTYTTEDIPGNYIVITREQWAEARPDAKIVDGKLVYTHIKRHVFKLEARGDGKYRSAAWDMNILVDQQDDIDSKNWGMAAYDIRR